MAYKKRPRRKNSPIQRKGSQGFPEGLNTLAHPSTLKDTELSELINGMYSQYGTISKRQGTLILGDAAENGTSIDQLQGAYNINGNDYFIRISDAGVPEFYNFTTVTWDELTATAPDGYSGNNPTFTTGTPTFDTTSTTWIKQVGSRLYFANEVNELIWLDDDGWHIYTAIADPTTLPAVVKTGSATGATKYFYQYVWYNEAGGTIASPPPIVDTHAEGTGWIDNMPQILDADTFLTLTLPAAPAGTTTVGIFKSVRQGEAFFLADVGPDDDTYEDIGEISTDTFYGVPDSNTTAGYHFSLLDIYRGSLVGVTTELGADTLVWSGAFDKFGSFALPDGAGFFQYRAGQGTTIQAIKTHVASNEDSLFIFKDDVFGKFQFITAAGEFQGEGRIQDVNISIGSISPLSPHVAGNNLRFWSEDGAGSVGNEANYGNILRYSVLSLRADSIVKRVTAANVPNVCGVFFNSLSLYGISTDVIGGGNNSILAYNEKYNSWSLWTGVYPKIFAKYKSPIDSVERLYYGSSLDANVLEMFNGKTDYRTGSGTGTRITLSLSTKQYDLNLPDQFKKFDKATIVFGVLTGNNTSVGIIKADQNGISNDARLLVTQESVLSGFGNDEWGNQEVGSMRNEDPGSTVNLRYVNLKQKDLFWVKVNIQNDGAEDEISIIGIYIYYSLSTRPLTFEMKLTELAA